MAPIPNIGYQDRLGKVGSAFESAMGSLDDYIEERGFDRVKNEYLVEIQDRMGAPSSEGTPRYSEQQRKQAAQRLQSIEDKSQFQAFATAWETQWLDFQNNPVGPLPMFGLSYNGYKQLRDPILKDMERKRLEGEDLGRRSNLAALRSEGAGGSGTPFSSEELEGFRGQFEGTPQEKGFEGLAGQRLGAEQLGAVEGDVARQGAAGRARPTAESATGAALNVAPGKPLSKPAKELLDLLPSQNDLDRLSDQKQRQRATMGARAGAIWDRQAKQLEGRINTDMGLAQKQKDRAKDLTDDVDKLTRAIAILRNTPKENILDEEEHAKKIDALDASLAKKLTQVTKANRAVEDAVKRVNEAETSYQSFLSDEGGLKDVLNAEAGRVKPPPSSETPEQRKARLRSILTGK